MLDVNIYKDFGNFALDVSFTTEKEILGILGASGSGKTLTLKCLAGLIKPDRGRIILSDRVLFDSEKKINLRPQERRIGYLFQDYALFPTMTVYENIRAGLRKGDQEEKVERMISDLNLREVRSSFPSTLSGGERQRTALARILVNGPDLLLLDEPYSAIDGFLRRSIELGIKETIEKYKILTLFVSHDRNEVYRMCDSITVMADGKNQDKRTTEELFSNPRTLEAARLSGYNNFSRLKKLEEGTYYADDWGLSLKLKNPPKSSLVGLHSRLIRVGEESSGENTYPLEVVREIEEIFTFTLLVRAKDSKGGQIMIDLDKDLWLSLRKREKIFFTLMEEDLIYLKA